MFLDRQVEILRARLAEDVPPVVTRGRDGCHRLLRRHVHDVQGRAREPRQHDRPMRRFLFGLPGARRAVVPRRGLAACERLRDEHVDGDAVLRVHHDERAVGGRGLHRPQDLAVVRVEDAGVRHEQFEAGDAFGHELVHGLQRIVVDAADDLVEPVVDRALPVGLVVPRGESVLDAFTGALDRESMIVVVPRAWPRAGLERVRATCRNRSSMCVWQSIRRG
jgi:hypothetical protein